MSIALKFKRAIAALSAGALFASSAGMALALNATDIQAGAWYVSYLQDLVDMDVVDDATNVRPGDFVNRAEVAKMTCLLTGCLTGYEKPGTPTFTDVPSTQWYFDYVEALAQLGVISGYEDANGNPTGKFGPGDNINRAALMKMVTYGFGIPEKLTPGSIFPDVQNTGDWFYNPVVTGYNWSIVDGKPNGLFDPSGNATRAETWKMLSNALNPVERVVTPPDVCEENPDLEECQNPPVDPSTGDLEVSLSSDTPLSSTLPMSANNVPMLSVDFTADQDDVVLQQLVVMRGGVGLRTDFEECFLYEGSKRVTTGKTINNDNMLTFPLKNWEIASGTTGTLNVVCTVADANTASPSSQHYFYIASAEDVSSNAQSVSGDFPVTGNTFTIGGTNTVVNTATFTAGSAPGSVNIAETDAEIASFKIEAGSTNDIGVYWITLTQGGSLDSDNMVNCRLLRGNDEVATAESFDGDLINFVLTQPYIIEQGQNRTFYVNCDIDGGKGGDTIKLYLDENTDAGVWDMQYGFGAKITNTFALANANEVALEASDVQVVDNGPAATQIASGANEIALLNYSIVAGFDELSVRFTDVLITVQDVAGNKPNFDSGSQTVTATAFNTGDCANTYDMTVGATTGFTAGDMFQLGNFYGRVTAVPDGTSICAASNSTLTGQTGTLTEKNPFAYIEDVKIVDLDTQSTVAGPLTFASSGSLCTAAATPIAICPTPAGKTYYGKEFTEDYELVPGEARHLSVSVDLAEQMVAGYRVNASVQYPTNSIKNVGSNQFIATSKIIGAGDSALGGDFMIVAESSLTVTTASTPTSNQYVKGDGAVPSLGASMAAGDAEDMLVKRINVRLYGDDDGTFDGTGLGDTAANSIVSSVTLYDENNEIVSGPESISIVDAANDGYTAGTDYYVATFDDLDVEIPAGSTKTLTAKVALLTTATATRYLALDIAPSSDMTVEDTDATTVTASGSNLNKSANPSPLITILTSGSLTASSEGNPDAAILVAGSKAQQVARYRFTAVDEAFAAKTLTIGNDLSGDIGDGLALTPSVNQVIIKYPNIDGVIQTKTASLSGSGAAKFSFQNATDTFYIHPGQDAYLDIYADVSTMQQGGGASLSGKTFRLGLQNVSNSITNTQFIGQSSSTNETFEDDTEVLNSSAINSFVVRKTKPVFANVASSTVLTSQEVTLMSFSVTADAAGSMSFGRLVFNISQNDADGGGDLDFDEFKLGRLNGPANITGVLIYDPADAGGENIGVGGNTLNNNNDGTQIIVSFAQEESVAAGQTVTYLLKATGVVVQNDDTVTTSLAIGDESTPISGLTTNNGNANTGKLSDVNTDNIALFGDASTQCSTTDSDVNAFATVVGTACNLIWSDKSADAHVYPTVASGTGNVTNASGSADWTNGYLLKLTDLSGHTLQQ